MLFDKFNIGVASIACLADIGNMGHRFRVLTWKDVMFPVAIITVRSPLGPLHDHFGVQTLLVLFLRRLMTPRTVYPALDRLLPPGGMGIVTDLRMAVRTGKVPMDGVLKPGFGYEEGNTLPEPVLTFERLILMTPETQAIVAPGGSSHPSRPNAEDQAPEQNSPNWTPLFYPFHAGPPLESEKRRIPLGDLLFHFFHRRT